MQHPKQTQYSMLQIKPYPKNTFRLSPSYFFIILLLFLTNFARALQHSARKQHNVNTHMLQPSSSLTTNFPSLLTNQLLQLKSSYKNSGYKMVPSHHQQQNSAKFLFNYFFFWDSSSSEEDEESVSDCGIWRSWSEKGGYNLAAWIEKLMHSSCFIWNWGNKQISCQVLGHIVGLHTWSLNPFFEIVPKSLYCLCVDFFRNHKIFWVVDEKMFVA